MRRLIAAATLALSAFAAHAAELKPVELTSGTTTSLPMFGVTAAWSIVPSIADASVDEGSVTIHGRSAGQTKVIAVTLAGQQTIDVTVKPRVSREAAVAARANEGGSVATRYSTGARQLQNELALRSGSGGRTSTLQVQTVTNTGDQRTSDRIATPSVTYTTAKNGRALTLFDQAQSLSPLTLDNVTLRGVHVETRDWEIHGGVTALATFQSFLLPTERQLVVSGARHLRSAAGTFTPSLVVLPRHDDVESKSVASLLYETPASLHGLDIAAELAWSDNLGGSLRAHRKSESSELDASFVHRPRAFGVAGPASQHGTFGDAAWHSALGPLTSDVRASVSRFDELHNQQRIDTASADLHVRLREEISASFGSSWSVIDTGALDVRSIVLHAGISYDSARAGATVIARYSRNSDDDRGGFGGRVSGRLTAGHFFASAYVDVQQQAPTLSLIYRDVPELEQALEELGIEATTPADIARALRENATLQQLGFIENVTVDLAPMRSQAGVELAWFGRSDMRRQLRVRIVRNRTEGVTADTQTTGASLTWSQRVNDRTDIFATLSRWETTRTGSRARILPSFDLGIRHDFNGVSGLFDRGGTISGIVFADEELLGEPTDAKGVAGAEVELDGRERQKTGADGRYAFRHVASGSHRVVVRTPELKDAYFTTPASADAARGEAVNFGVATSPAHVFGSVRCGANGVGGVRLVLRRAARELTASTLSDGTFAFVATPGEWEIELKIESLPPGFLMDGAAVQTIMLDRKAPREVAFPLRANRSISGKVLTTSLPATITIRETGKTIHTAADGAYSLRGLPAGAVTLEAAAGNERWTREVTVPEGPAILRGIDFGTTLLAATSAAPRDVIVVGENGFFVQLGAFRVEANAQEAVDRARANGADARIVASKDLMLVRIGPYASAPLAARTASRLQDAGLDAVVLRVR